MVHISNGPLKAPMFMSRIPMRATPRTTSMVGMRSRCVTGRGAGSGGDAGSTATVVASGVQRLRNRGRSLNKGWGG